MTIESHLPWYTITDDLGNEAEAQGIAAARVAAKTLVEDGATEATITFMDMRPTFESAKRDRFGNIFLRTSDVSRSLR